METGKAGCADDAEWAHHADHVCAVRRRGGGRVGWFSRRHGEAFCPWERRKNRSQPVRAPVRRNYFGHAPVPPVHALREQRYDHEGVGHSKKDLLPGDVPRPHGQSFPGAVQPGRVDRRVGGARWGREHLGPHGRQTAVPVQELPRVGDHLHCLSPVRVHPGDGQSGQNDQILGHRPVQFSFYHYDRQ